jgi:hypothetical protein
MKSVRERRAAGGSKMPVFGSSVDDDNRAQGETDIERRGPGSDN